MNREIKFRAWDVEAKKMHVDVTHAYGILPINEQRKKEGLAEINFFHISRGPGKRYEVMQYIGLTDKKGKEVYEGDICQVDAGYEGDKWIETWRGVVIFESGGFFVADKINNQWMDIDLNMYTIIGNIYENPELTIDT